MTCPTCKDNGIVIDREAGYWDVCPEDCAAARAFNEAMQKGIADIEAGRVHKWSDVRRGIR